MISTVMASSSLSNQVSIVANELHLLGDIHVTDEPWVLRLTSPAASVEKVHSPVTSEPETANVLYLERPT